MSALGDKVVVRFERATVLPPQSRKSVYEQRG
jgi:hypothetical protein